MASLMGGGLTSTFFSHLAIAAGIASIKTVEISGAVPPGI